MMRLWVQDFGDDLPLRGCFVAVAIGGSAVAGLAGSALQANAAGSAASTEANAQLAGIQAQTNMFDITQANLLPYMKYGQWGLNILNGTGPTSLTSLTAPWMLPTGYASTAAAPNPALTTTPAAGGATTPTVGGTPIGSSTPTTSNQTLLSQLQATPGYQFTLQQGEQATANGVTAEGLGQNNPATGASGAFAKATTNYAEGLASTTFNQQLANYLNQNQQIYGMLSGAVGQGANAAANLGGFGTATGQGISGNLAAAGASNAAGIVGQANAFSGGLNNVGNSLLTYAMFNNMMNPGGNAAGEPAGYIGAA